MSTRRARGGVFLAVALGQIASFFGSQLTRFVLGVWVFESTGSAARFTLIAFFATVPHLVFLPLAGTLADRWDRRRMMILGDLGAGLVTLLLFFLAATGELEVGHIYALVALGAILSAGQMPAFQASTVLLVPRDHLPRANALVELGRALAMAGAPVIAAVLFETVGLHGVILIDLATFTVAVTILLLVRIPRPAAGLEADEEDPAETAEPERRLLSELRVAWRWLRERPGLVELMIFVAVANFVLGSTQISMTPLILSFASVESLGWVLSVAAAGMLAGGLTVAWSGGPRREPRFLFLLFAVQGTALLLGGPWPRVELVALAVGVAAFCQPSIVGLYQTLWQTRVPPALQGRIFALRNLAVDSSFPLAFLVSGVVIEHLCDPLLAPGGALANTAAAKLGNGAGRGAALYLAALAVILIVTAVLARRSARLKRFEEDLPEIDPHS